MKEKHGLCWQKLKHKKPYLSLTSINPYSVIIADLFSNGYTTVFSKGAVRYRFWWYCCYFKLWRLYPSLCSMSWYLNHEHFYECMLYFNVLKKAVLKIGLLKYNQWQRWRLGWIFGFVWNRTCRGAVDDEFSFILLDFECVMCF